MSKKEDEIWEQFLGANISVRFPVTVESLAQELGCRPYQLVKKLMFLGEFMGFKDRLSPEVIKKLAEELGANIEIDEDEGNVPKSTTIGPKIPPSLSGEFETEE